LRNSSKIVRLKPTNRHVRKDAFRSKLKGLVGGEELERQV
jgi:hypothetical protein